MSFHNFSRRMKSTVHRVSFWKPWDESLHSVTMATIWDNPPCPPDDHNVPVLYVMPSIYRCRPFPLRIYVSPPRLLYLPHQLPDFY
jgi:hypothetical protein